MTFTRPIGNLNWRGQAPDTLTDDEERFERLRGFLPSKENLRRMVERFVEAERTRGLSAALGDPTSIAQELAHVLRSEGVEFDATDLNRRVRMDLRGAGQREAAGPSGETVIDAEVDYVMQEIPRFWVDTLLLAWEMADEPELGLALDAELLPSGSNPSLPSDWTEALNESRRSLRNAVALQSDDLVNVLAGFNKNVQLAAGQAPVELPDGVAVVARTDGLRLVARLPSPCITTDRD